MLFFHLYIGFFLAVLEFYFIISLFLILMVIYAANAVYAILFLISTFLMVGFTFILLGAEYLGLVLMIVYVGAIAILFLFILMLLDLRNLMKQQITSGEMIIFAFCVFFATEYVMYTFNFGPFYLLNTSVEVFFGSFNNSFLSDALLLISPNLFNIYLYYVIGCGFILLFVMLGVVLLLADSAFPFNEQKLRSNKYLTNYLKVVKLAHVKKG